MKKSQEAPEVREVAAKIDRTQAKDAATAVGASLVLVRSMDDALVILHDAIQVGTRQYMRTAIEHATRALMAQDRTVAIRLRRMAQQNGVQTIPDQPPLTPEIVTLCGSSRYAATFQQKQAELELSGKVVLSMPIVAERDAKAHNIKLRVAGHDDPVQHAAMVELHKRKIDIADSILVINPKLKAKDKYGYIGESTAQEIVYASMSKKPIAALESLPPMEEIIKIAGLTLTSKQEAEAVA